MSELTIRQYGDPVLKERTREVEEIDGAVASLVDSMIETMYAAPGSGLAANPRVSVTPLDGARFLVQAPDHRALSDVLAATPRPPGRGLRVEVDPTAL